MVAAILPAAVPVVRPAAAFTDKTLRLDDLRFALGALLAVAVLVGFVVSLHLLGT